MNYSSENFKRSTEIYSYHEAFEELEKAVETALETYSNVHRGTGHFSMITTELYEHARDVVLEYFGLKKQEYVVVFCSGIGSEMLTKKLQQLDYFMISSTDIDLPLGIYAVAIDKTAIPKGMPFYTGGSTVKMVSPDMVIWADTPQKFEAGTPNIINAIAFAIGLKLIKKYEADCFIVDDEVKGSVNEILFMDEFSVYSGESLLDELRNQLVGKDILVPTTEGHKPFINLDNAASTPTFHPIWDVVKKVWRQPEDMHIKIIREVRKIVADFLGACQEKYEIIFTSNTTEAINIAAQMIHDEFQDEESELVILNTMMEHNSNELPWRYITGASLMRLSVDDEGFINLDELKRTLREYNQENIYGNKRIRIVAVSGASNVLGTYTDLEAVSNIAHRYGARLLVDAAQVIAHRSINMEALNIDYLAFSGHKIYAPFGSGALIVKKEYVKIATSELDNILRSGEENVAGIAALGKAINLLQRIGLEIIEARERYLLRSLLNGLSQIEDIEIFGVADPDSDKVDKLGGIVSFSMKKLPHNLVADKLAERGGIGVRNGCFCAHLLVKQLFRIHPIRACGANIGLMMMPQLTSVMLPGLVRVSLGIENTESDIDKLIEVLNSIIKYPNSNINKLLAFTRNGTPFLSRNGVHSQIGVLLKDRVKKIYLQYTDNISQNKKLSFTKN